MHKDDKRSQGRDCTASEYQDPQCNCRAYPWNGKKKATDQDYQAY